MEKQQRQNLLDMVQGGVRERIQIEFDKVIDNIINPNTDANKKRVINLKIELSPDAERQTIGVSFLADSKLVPMNSIKTAIYLGADPNTGEVAAIEMTPQIPGQTDLNQGEQKPGKVIPITTKQALAN